MGVKRVYRVRRENFERHGVLVASDWSVNHDDTIQERNPDSSLQKYESKDGEVPSHVLPT